MSNNTNPVRPKPRISLGKFIGLMIVFAFVAVALFGALIFMFVVGAQKMGLSTPVYIGIFVIISAIFAWLLKRVSDAASELSRAWFPEDTDPSD